MTKIICDVKLEMIKEKRKQYTMAKSPMENTLKINVLLGVYNYQKVNYIFFMKDKKTILYLLYIYNL